MLLFRPAPGGRVVKERRRTWFPQQADAQPFSAFPFFTAGLHVLMMSGTWDPLWSQAPASLQGFLNFIRMFQQRKEEYGW